MTATSSSLAGRQK